MTFRATLIGRLIRLIPPTAPTACFGPQKRIASLVTSPSSSGRPPNPTLRFSGSISAWFTPFSTASSALPPASSTFHASAFAAFPNSHVEMTAGSAARTVGSEATAESPAAPAMNSRRLSIGPSLVLREIGLLDVAGLPAPPDLPLARIQEDDVLRFRALDSSKHQERAMFGAT